MIPQTSRHFVIMVHYGDPAPTIAALQALWAGARAPDRIIIIDHAEIPLLLPVHAGQQVVRPADNAGYAAGLNVGLGVVFAANPADTDIVICMNNDALVSRASLQQLADYFRDATQPTLVGARWGHINPLTGRTRLVPSDTRDSTSALAYIDGSFFAAPWLVWRRVKKIPDEYFMYWEECTLNTQLMQHGVARHVLPQLGVRHDDDASSLQSDLHTYYLVRNGAHYLQTFTLWPLRWWWRGYNRVRLVYHRLSGQKSTIVQQALRDAVTGTMGKKKTVL